MKKFLRRRSLICVLILAAVLGAGLWLFGSTSGARFVVNQIGRASGGALSVAQMSGSLSAQLNFEDIRLDTPSALIRVDFASAVLEWSSLVRGRFAVRDLYLSVLNVELKPQDTSREPESWTGPGPALPFGLELGSAVIAGVQLTGDVQPVDIGQLTLAATYVDQVLHIARLEAQYEQFTVSLQGDLDLRSEPNFDVVGSLAGRYDGLPVLVSADVSGTQSAILVDTELIEPTAIRASGVVDTSAGPRFDLDVNWAEVDRRLIRSVGLEGLRVETGSGRLDGVPDDFEFSSETRAQWGEHVVDLDLLGRYQPGSVLLTAGRLRRGDGTLEISGRLDTAAQRFLAELSGTRLNPEWFVPGWRGEVALDGNFEGNFRDGGTVETSDLAFSGSVRDQQFNAAVAGLFDAGGNARIDGVELHMGPNSLNVSGTLGARQLLAIRADFPDLSVLADGLAGSLQGAGQVDGEAAQAQLSVTMQAENFAWNGGQIGTLEVRAQGGLATDGNIDLQADLGDARVGNAALAQISLRASGTSADHRIELSGLADDWSTGLQLSGRLAQISGEYVWDGALDSAQYLLPPFGEWRLRNPAVMQLTGERFALEQACLGNSASELCVRLAQDYGGEGSVQLSARRLDLAMLAPVLPPGLSATGQYQADIALSGTPDEITGVMRVAGGRSEFRVTQDSESDPAAVLESVELEVDLATEGFAGSSVLRGVGSDEIQIQLDGNRGPGGEISIAGSVDARWAELAPLGARSSHVGEVAGQRVASVDIGGTLAAPSLDGRVRLTDGQVELPTWGVIAESIEGTATGQAGQPVAFEATGQIDGGTVELTGTMGLNAAQGWPTQLAIVGDRIHLVQVADADIYVSPRLDVDIDLPAIRVAGVVEVPEALIAVAQLPEQAVRPSADAIVHGGGDTQTEPPIALDADIDLRLGDAVRYLGSGLDADLGGGLRLRYATDSSVNATGRLSMEGQYEAYGQELTLEPSELIFTGSLENPTLAVRAARSIDPVKVGIDLSGTLRSPVSRMFSEPSMAEGDALSYLLFGRPLSAPGDPDGDQLRSAAVSLGLRQAVPAIQRLGNSLGLDELAIESTDVDAGELMAGKYLSPKLYVRYSYGLFNRIGGLLLQYRLNDRFSIETRSGDQKSMDLLYTIEKD